MITYETTRAKTLFDAFFSTSTSSSTENRVTNGITYFQNGFGTFSRTYGHSNNETFIGETRGISAGATFGTATNSNTGGTTLGTTVNSTGSITSSSVSNVSANSSTTNIFNTNAANTTTNAGTTALTLDSTTTTTYEVNLVTSSTFTELYSDPYDTTNRTVTRTATTYSSSYAWDDETYYNDATFTTTAASTVVMPTTTALTITGPFETGTVVKAENDRLYSFASTGGYAFPSASFTQQTFFNNQTALSVEFLTYGLPVTTLSYTNPDDKITISVPTFSHTSYALTNTSGQSIPRETTTGQGYGVAANSFSFTTGTNSVTGSGLVTFIETTLQAIQTTAQMTTIASDKQDRTTTTAGTGTTTTTTYGYSTTVFPGDPLRSVFQASSTYSFTQNGTGTASAIHATTASAFGVSKAKTATFDIATNITGSTGRVDAYQRVPRVGGMKSPKSMMQSNSTGTNIGYPSTIYYPWVSSVQPNVMVPVKRNGTVSTGSTTWKYSWDEFSLYWTSKNSVTSASGSGGISVAGSNTGDVWQQKNGYPLLVVGGFAPVTTAAQLAVLTPGGRKVTTYDTAGGTTTAKTILPALQTMTVADIARVEQPLRVFSVATTYGNGSPPVVSFTRN